MATHKARRSRLVQILEKARLHPVCLKRIVVALLQAWQLGFGSFYFCSPVHGRQLRRLTLFKASSERHLGTGESRLKVKNVKKFRLAAACGLLLALAEFELPKLSEIPLRSLTLRCPPCTWCSCQRIKSQKQTQASTPRLRLLGRRWTLLKSQNSLTSTNVS